MTGPTIEAARIRAREVLTRLRREHNQLRSEIPVRESVLRGLKASLQDKEYEIRCLEEVLEHSSQYSGLQDS